MSNKKFTLIELIVVIATLGILAGIIIPNISGFKDEAIEVSYIADCKNIQTAVDMYRTDNRGNIPTLVEPTLSIPTEIDFNKLVHNYLRKEPRKGYYWVDITGQVWISSIDAPTGFREQDGFIYWNASEGEVISYNVYGINKTSGSNIKNVTLLDTVTNLEFDVSGYNYESFAISAVDIHNLETARVAFNYTGISKYSGTEEYLNKGKVITENLYKVVSSPETGWKRIEDSSTGFKYSSSFSSLNADIYSGNNLHFIPTDISSDNPELSTMEFSFEGTDLRLIATMNDGSTSGTKHSDDIVLIIDGYEVGHFSQFKEREHRVIFAEIVDLPEGIHSVKIYSANGVRYSFDAIDINSEGKIIE